MNTFGPRLREARRSAGKTLEDVASHLGVSIPYVSDIERGNRAPLSNAKISVVAAFLGTDAEDLICAAAESRGSFDLDPLQSPMHRETGAVLMRGWSELSGEDLENIRAIVNKRMVGR